MLLNGRPLSGSPRDDELFIGRRVELTQIADACTAGLNTIVFGDRGSGKTTLLRRLAVDLEKRGFAHVFHVDAAATPDPQAMVRRIREELVGPEFRTVNSLTIAMERAIGKSEWRWTPAGEMLRELEKLHDDLTEPESKPGMGDAGLLHETGSRAVVILDGPTGQAAHTVFGRLRDEVWELPIVWVVAANRSARATILEPPADAFFEVRVDLKPMTPVEAEELIRVRIGPSREYQNAAIERLVELTDRQPRALVSALRVHHESLLTGNDSQLDDAEVARAEIAEKIAGLGAPASMLVEELRARGGAASASDSEMLASLGWTRERAVQVLRKLEGAGLVTTTSQSGDGRAGRPRKVYELVEEAK